ncbi:MAG: PEP-utilizing enzyme [Patescibacteria group bacterium]
MALMIESKTAVRIYDNSNLAESYAGAVAPLTTSFANSLYEGVYRHFTSFMGVSTADQHRHEAMFSQMVVSIGYHLYYDLQNWYTLVSLLPGYAYNKSFFEHMLGIPPGAGVVVPSHAKRKKVRKALSSTRLVVQLAKIALVFCAMPILVARFNRRFDQVFKQLSGMKLAELDYKELCNHYQNMRRDLVRLWRVPIANDFAVMVSTGIARSLYKKWALDDEFVTRLTLLSRASLSTLDPGRLLVKMKKQSATDATISALLESQTTAKEVYKRLCREHADTVCVKSIIAYIAQYGSRVPNELKLEAATLHEEPEHIVTMLRAIGNTDSDLFQNRVAGGVGYVPLRIPVQGFWKQKLLAWMLGWARASIRRREETRLRRTQIFGHARQVFLATGQHLMNEGIIASTADVMFLTAQELCAADATFLWRTRIDERKKNMSRWEQISMPTRIESADSIQEIEKKIFSTSVASVSATTPHLLRGVVASRAGRTTVSGKVLVLREFDHNADFRDRILVTRHTDPGWTVVFPLVRAIVVERGGILSHASIVAREMGIPCLIGVSTATTDIPQNAEIDINLIDGLLSIRDASRVTIT